MAGYYDELSSIYYYFVSSPDSYLNYLNDNLINKTPTGSGNNGTQLANDLWTDAKNTDLNNIFYRTGLFVVNDLIYAGTGADLATPSSSVDRWTLPSSMSTTAQSAIKKFINGILSTYLSAIIPDAEKYVMDMVLPAINTMSDTQKMDVASGDAVLTEIQTQSVLLAHKLMSIGGDYSLTTMIPHIWTMYQSLDLLIGLGYASGNIGEFVGAVLPGTATGWSDATLSGNAVAYDNFELFDNLYLSYSRALITTLYGYAMDGKAEALEAMYNGTLDKLVPSYNTAASAISTTAAHEGVAVPTGTPTTTYQQGVWDVYHYIYPFYKAAKADKETGNTILRKNYSSDAEYVAAVWSRIQSDATVTGGTTAGINAFDNDKKTVSDTKVTLGAEDSTDSNPHDVSSEVSPQTEAYLVSFYTNYASANTMNYQLQPVKVVNYVDDTGAIYNTITTDLTDVNGGSVLTAISTGTPGDGIDGTNLPATAYDGSTKYNKPSDLSSYYIYENGGIIDVAYSTENIIIGTINIDAHGNPADATYSYIVYNKDMSIASSGTTTYVATPSFVLDEGQTIEVTPVAYTDYAITPSETQTVTFDDTINGTNNLTFDYAAEEVNVTVNFVDSDGKAITQTYASGSKQGTSQYNVVYKTYTAPTLTVKAGSDGTVTADDVVDAISADETFALPQKYVYTRSLGGDAMNYRISATQTAKVMQDADGNWTVSIQMDTPIAVALAIRAHNGTNAYGDQCIW